VLSRSRFGKIGVRHDDPGDVMIKLSEVGRKGGTPLVMN
jgi:hypothetical protein